MAKQRALKSKPKDSSATLAWSAGADYPFDKESILAHVPQTSGVYGLDHFGIQLFIGESANLREALLSHYYRRDFQTDLGRPTGFTFEVCDVEVSAQKAQRLIALFEPVHQTEFVPKKTWGFISDPGVEEPYSFGEPLEHEVDLPLGAPGLTRPVRKRFFFVRRQLVVLTATFALSLAVVFYLGILTGENLRKKPSGHLENSGVEVTGAAPAQELASMAGSSESPVVSPAATELEPVEAKSTPLAELQVPTATEPKENPAPAPAAAKKAIATTSPAELARVEASKQAAVVKPVSRSDSGAEGGKTWSVQVGASPAKKAIEDQVARLKAKGYESYIVEVERNGQTLYRARVGRFGARAEAETLRQTLESQDGLKSAFIISSDEARPAPAAPSESNSASQ